MRQSASQGAMLLPEKEKKERKNKRKISFKDDEMET